MSEITKITKGISFDKELIEVADKLVVNRSRSAQEGLLKAVLEKIENLEPKLQQEYRKRLDHLIDDV